MKPLTATERTGLLRSLPDPRVVRLLAERDELARLVRVALDGGFVHAASEDDGAGHTWVDEWASDEAVWAEEVLAGAVELPGRSR